MANTLRTHQRRNRPQVAKSADVEPINAEDLVSEGDDVEALQSKIRKAAFTRQMHDLRNNPANDKLRKCYRPELDPVTGQMLSLTTAGSSPYAADSLLTIILC